MPRLMAAAVYAAPLLLLASVRPESSFGPYSVDGDMGPFAPVKAPPFNPAGYKAPSFGVNTFWDIPDGRRPISWSPLEGVMMAGPIIEVHTLQKERDFAACGALCADVPSEGCKAFTIRGFKCQLKADIDPFEEAGAL